MTPGDSQNRLHFRISPKILCSYPPSFLMAARTAEISRKTNETQIEVSINLDCQPGSGRTQEISVSTGIGFLDHVSYHNSWNIWEMLIHFLVKMYHALAKHSGMSLTMKCKGDLWIDDHHTADESAYPSPAFLTVCLSL